MKSYFNTKKVYIISLLSVLLASVYPIYMGTVMLIAYFRDGGVQAENYPKYIIPYTPICIAVILTVALLPVIIKFFKRYAMPAASLLGSAVFLISELSFEKITVFETVSEGFDVSTWQALSCMATPEAIRVISKTLSQEYSPAFKIHFYIISFLIILSVTGVIYGFFKMYESKNFLKRTPLTVQLISVTVFIALCVFACFTAFFRTGELTVSPLSAILMAVFFTVFGVTAGVYSGTIFYGEKKFISVILPSLISALTTLIMYIGEMFLMGGTVYRLGTGFFFEPLGVLVLSAADLMIIAFSGALAYFILNFIRPDKKSKI